MFKKRNIQLYKRSVYIGFIFRFKNKRCDHSRDKRNCRFQNKEYKTVIKKIGQPTSDFRGMFYGYHYGDILYDAKIEKVKFMGNVEFENNSMKYLFYGCQALKEIDIVKIDFSKISSVDSWLSSCDSIISQDQIKGFNNLSKLPKMFALFYGLKNIQSLDLSS